MQSLKALISCRGWAFAFAGLLLVSCASMPTTRSGDAAKATVNGLYAAAELPEGFHQVLHPEEGPLFTDSRGMTLYLWSGSRAPFCKNEPDAIGSNLGPLMQSLASSTPSCASQWPPVLAPDNAKPVRDWTIVTRPEGTKQWAYRGHPVHTSYKDLLPGDVNGATGTERRGMYFVVAQPPTLTPPGIKLVTRRAAGVVAMTSQNRMIYVGVNSEQPAAGSREKTSLHKEKESSGNGEYEHWKPLQASALSSSPIGAWSISTRTDGSELWAYQNQLIYTYDNDDKSDDVSGLGIDGARPLIVLPAPKAPIGVSARRSYVGPVFTDSKGMSLYYFHCERLNPAGRDAPQGQTVYCDNWNDVVPYRELYCPAADRCSELWRPFAAPANEKARGGVWSLAVIPDPVHYPLRWVPLNDPAAKTPGAIKVRTYRGHPLYTSVADQDPGDIRGHNFWSQHTSKWSVLVAGAPERGRY